MHNPIFGKPENVYKLINENDLGEHVMSGQEKDGMLTIALDDVTDVTKVIDNEDYMDSMGVMLL